MYIWTLVEPGLYLIAACLITYRPLLEKFNPKALTTHGSGWPSKPDPASGAIHSGYSKPTSRTAKSQVTVDYAAQDHDQGILLSGYRAKGQGFEQLTDLEDNPACAEPVRPRVPGIVKTTNIHMSWDRKYNGGVHNQQGY